MARVDFYVMKASGEQARRHFACKLAEKAYRLENTVHIVAASREDAAKLDELMWTFRDGSFVPHQLIPAADLDSPITIGCESDPTDARDLLINLCDDVPAVAESFPRVAELVTSDEGAKQCSRRRYAAYRDQGHNINTHNV
ncbi:MAG: DNA polymerase III subunit chi [Woeseiaceae bacterium]|nr:DNA polymerase III subunit chi [Woeseiaceae bacterium]